MYSITYLKEFKGGYTLMKLSTHKSSLNFLWHNEFMCDGCVYGQKNFYIKNAAFSLPTVCWGKRKFTLTQFIGCHSMIKIKVWEWLEMLLGKIYKKISWPSVSLATNFISPIKNLWFFVAGDEIYDFNFQRLFKQFKMVW